MSKSLRNDRRFSDDYEYEDAISNQKAKKAQRRQDKRAQRELPCERDN